ncbi:zinc-ribbon domain-containing protein [Methanolobus sp. ZRKC2]|uniref:zinc-ribbon domain-containing protein n=1 Tax=Methanolobus sp. ZRKC2 TaxID=3125783 RepID=UPI00324CC0F2
MTLKHLRHPFIFILIILFFTPTAVSSSADEYDVVLMEGEFVELSSGYYLNVLDVDTYSDGAELTITYYGTVLSENYYRAGDYFYYDDDVIQLEFYIEDTYTIDYTDYVLLSDVYFYDSSFDTESTAEAADNTNDAYYYDDKNYYDSSSDSEGFPNLIPILAILFFPFLILRKSLKRRKGKKEAMAVQPKKQTKTTSPPAKGATTTTPASKPMEVKGVVIKSAVQYKGANILYKVKVENPSQEPVGDIKVSLFVPDVFKLKEADRTISMLQPGEGKTATFEIRPTGECGNCIISGNIRYYDYSQKKHIQLDLSNKMVDIVCPVLRTVETDEYTWREDVRKMLIAEEDTKDLEIPAENLFGIATRILKDMNLYMIPPEITSTQQLYTGVARFYAEGVAGLKYAAYIEVVGKRKSRLIVKAWAEKEEALTGFYHKILEEIGKRTDIKLFVDDSITQYNINKTTISDSVIQRSNIGNEKNRCSNCGREAKAGEKFCMNCGERLE